MKTLLVLFFVHFTVKITAQISHPVAAPYFFYGGYTGSVVNSYTAQNNPGLLSQLRSPEIAVYTEKRFWQNALGFYGFSVGLKTGSGGFALHGNYYGNALFNQTKMAIAYGLKANKKLSVGVQFNYHALHQGNGYGTSMNINGTAGMVLYLTEAIQMGLCVENLGLNKWNNMKEERIPFRYACGIGYTISEKISLHTAIIKEEAITPGIYAAMKYVFAKQLTVSAGIHTSTATFYSGIALQLPRYSIDFVNSYHPQLGLSSGLLMGFKLEKAQ